MRCRFAATRYAGRLREPNAQSLRVQGVSPSPSSQCQCPGLPRYAVYTPAYTRGASVSESLRIQVVSSPPRSAAALLSPSAIPRRFLENSDRSRLPTVASLLVAARAPSALLSPRPGSLHGTKQARNPAGAVRKSRSGSAAPARSTPPPGAARQRPRSSGSGPRLRRPRPASLPSAGAAAAAGASAPLAQRQVPGRKLSGRRLPERCPAGRSPFGSGKSPAPGSPSR